MPTRRTSSLPPPIAEETLREAADALRALTHPDRLRICQALLQAPTTVNDLAEQLALRQSVVSQHLQLLRAHRMVRGERAGRSICYRVTHDAPRWLLTCIHKNHRAG